MRCFAIVTLLIFAAPSAYAQSYNAQHNYPAPNQYPAQQQVSDNTYAAPVYTPQDYVVQPQPANPARTASPSDYGQSVMTDIRQMNF